MGLWNPLLFSIAIKKYPVVHTAMLLLKMPVSMNAFTYKPDEFRQWGLAWWLIFNNLRWCRINWSHFLSSLYEPVKCIVIVVITMHNFSLYCITITHSGFPHDAVGICLIVCLYMCLFVAHRLTTVCVRTYSIIIDDVCVRACTHAWDDVMMHVYILIICGLQVCLCCPTIRLWSTSSFVFSLNQRWALTVYSQHFTSYFLGEWIASICSPTIISKSLSVLYNLYIAMEPPWHSR